MSDLKLPDAAALYALGLSFAWLAADGRLICAASSAGAVRDPVPGACWLYARRPSTGVYELCALSV